METMVGVEVIAIVGEDGVGKSTLAQALGAQLGWPVGETSDVVGAVAARLCKRLPWFEGWSDERVAKYLHLNKPSYREFKRELGDVLCAERAGYLVERCLADGARIVVGMRRPVEFAALLEATFGKKVLLVMVTAGLADEPSQLSIECGILAQSRGKCRLDVRSWPGEADKLKHCAAAVANEITGKSDLAGDVDGSGDRE